MGQYQSQNEIIEEKKPEPVSEPQPSKRITQFEQHEGILKLRKVPFRNSVQISEQPPLFLENIPETLSDILQSRYNTNRYFSEYQIQQLVESILYTLSFLETKGIPYSNLSTENIHFDENQNNYKLLPLELIKFNIYEEALKNKRFGFLSPELILGLRYKEREIDPEIMNKSNVFTLGMILLEVATLQPSFQCYSPKQNEILDDVITERLEKVQEIYQPQIERLIEIMIEYDYTKRMNLQELSILVNKTLARNSINSSSSMKKSKSFSRFKIIDESLLHDRPEKQTISRIQERPPSKNISPSRLKANTVLPVNYHQAPRKQSIQYQIPEPQPEPQYQQQSRLLGKQKSTRRFSYEQQNQQEQDPYYYQPQYQSKFNPNQYAQYQVNYIPQQQLYPHNSSYLQVPYHQSQNYPPQYSQYTNHHQAFQYPEMNQMNQINQMNQTPKYQPHKISNTIYPEPQKSSPVYYEPENDIPQYDYNPPRRASFSNYPADSPHHLPIYEEPVKHNPYINYQQPPSKQLSFEQQYEDSFAKNVSSNILKNNNYMPPHRDTSNVYRENNPQRYERRSNDLSDLSDSSIVKIKEQIAKSRQLIMELQRHDSGQRR